jgi:hypothetical protein
MYSERYAPPPALSDPDTIGTLMDFVPAKALSELIDAPLAHQNDGAAAPTVAASELK